MSFEKELSNFSLVGAATTVASLCTMVDFQPFTYRLEELLTLISKHSRGEHTPSKNSVTSWMNHYLSSIAHAEDPPEYPFIMKVSSSQGTFRLFEGLATNASSHIEYLCNIFDRADTPSGLIPQMRQTYSLLFLGDLIAERLGLEAYIGQGYKKSFTMPAMSVVQKHIEALTFDIADLYLKYPHLDLSAFITSDPSTYTQAVSDEVGPMLERFPLFQEGDKIYVLAPSFLGGALRRNILEAILAGHHEAWFSMAIADEHRYKATDIFSRISDIEQMPNPFDEKSIDPKLSCFTNFFGIFDNNKVLHISIVHFDSTKVINEGLRCFHKVDKATEDAFSDFLTDHVGTYFKKIGYHEGLHLTMPSSTGEFCSFGIKNIADGWSSINFSLTDLDVLMSDEGFSFSRIYKYVREINRLHAKDIKLVPFWDTFPLYSQWRLNDFKFFTRNMPYPHLNMLAIGFDAALPFCTEILKRVDERTFYVSDDKRYLKFRRFGFNTFFSYDLHKPLYACYDKIDEKILYGVVKRNEYEWHIKVDAKKHTQNFDILYKFWEMLLNRMLQIVGNALHLNLKLNPLLLIEIDFDPNFDWQHKPTDSEKVISKVKVLDKYHFLLNIGSDILELMMTPENSGERFIMEILLEAVLIASGDIISGDEIKNIVRLIEPKNDTRYIHLFEDNRPTSLKRFPLERERIIQGEDESFFSLGLAWDISPFQKPATINGQKECLDFYVQAVDKYWGMLKAQLNLFRKDEIIDFSMRNLNSLKNEGVLWDNTSKAVMALSHDPAETYRVASKQSRERDTASLCNRILIEMANCECLGAQAATLINIDELLARIAVLLDLAASRDAISVGLAPAQIIIHENGEIAVDGNIINSLIPKYIQALDEKSFDKAIEEYESHFEERKEGKDFATIYGAALIKAFEDEFKIKPERLLAVYFAINEIALRDNLPQFRIRLSALKKYLQEDEVKITDLELEAVINNFVLFPRAKWEDAPKGFTINDILPWRYQRRLSLVLRPILALDLSDDPEFFINMSLLWSNFDNYMYLILHGYLKQDFVKSASMTSYLGDATRIEGAAFEYRCQEVLEAGGYIVKPSIEMSTLGADPSLGEVDLFVWRDKEPNKIFIVECKKLKLAKTVGEIGDQLEKFKGDADDLLSKHLTRVDWIGKNAEGVIKVLGLAAKKPKFFPLIITSNPVPMQFYPNHPNISPQSVINFDMINKVFKI